MLEDARVPDVLLEECPIALGNPLKEADSAGPSPASIGRISMLLLVQDGVSLWSMIQPVSFGMVCLNADLPVPNVT